MAGLSGDASAMWNSSRLRSSRTIEISSLSDTARQGASSLASDHSGHGRQIHRGEQVAGRVVGQGIRANLYLFASLSDHNHARLVGEVARGRWRRSLVQRQARNSGCLLLCGANQPGNPGRQLRPSVHALDPPRGPLRHEVLSQCLDSTFRITANCASGATDGDTVQ